jgi:hypothetical protein
MKPAKFSKSLLTTSYLLLATSCLLLAKPLLAAETSTGLSAIPPRLEVTVNADASNTQIIKVRNESQEPKTITVSVRDFIVTDNKGTPNFIDDFSEELNNRWAASSWIQVSPTSLTLKGGETKNLTLTVLPPANALPGGHYAAVVYSPKSNSLYGSATGASIKTNVGTLVYVSVPGDINQSATIKSFTAPGFSEFGPIDFNATVKNSSDVHIQPVGAITVKNWLGGKTAQLNLDSTNIFPYTTRDFKNTLDKKWLFGRYKATMQAVYGTAGGLITATIFFWVIPWRLIILIIAAIAVVTTLIIVLKKKPTTPKSSDTEVAELEKELEELKKKYKD